jgi:CrcB protein
VPRIPGDVNHVFSPSGQDWIFKNMVHIPWSAITETISEMGRSLKPAGMHVVLVMAGGSLGALCRYGAGIMAGRLFSSRFPWATMAVNLLGCFLIGICFALAERTELLSPSARLFFMTGFLGALTTFSSYALETVAAFSGESLLVPTVNVMANNGLGLMLVVAGMGLVRLIRP